MTDSSSTSQLAKRIVDLRKERGWPARELAERCARAGSTSLNRSTLAKIESGVRKSVTATEVAVLASVFEVSVDALLDIRTGPVPNLETPPLQSAESSPPPPTVSSTKRLGATRRSQDSVRRIGHVEDHEVAAFGLSMVLADEPDLELVLATSTAQALLDQTDDLDLVVLDLRLGDGSSPSDNVKAFRDHGMGVLIFTSAEDPFLIRQAVSEGVLGVIRKSMPAEAVVDAVRRAANGDLVFTTEFAAAIDSDPGLALSPRQRQVLELYASGANAVTVARIMGLTEVTVHDYLHRIRKKYAEAGRPAYTKTDLYQRAVEDGWLPMPERPSR